LRHNKPRRTNGSHLQKFTTLHWIHFSKKNFISI
jgi:hypothetical protein